MLVAVQAWGVKSLFAMGMRIASPRLTLAVLALLGAGALAGSSGAQEAAADPNMVQPGRWEYKYRLLGFIPAATEHWCLKPNEIEKAFQGPCNRHHTCTYPTREVGGGRAKLVGQWADKRGRIAPVSGEGTYTPTTISLSVRGRTTTGFPFSGTMRAKRIADDCQPGDK